MMVMQQHNSRRWLASGLATVLLGVMLFVVVPSSWAIWPFKKKDKPPAIENYEPPAFDAKERECEPIRQEIRDIYSKSPAAKAFLIPKREYLLSKHRKCVERILTQEYEYLKHADVANPTLEKLEGKPENIEDLTPQPADPVTLPERVVEESPELDDALDTGVPDTDALDVTADTMDTDKTDTMVPVEIDPEVLAKKMRKAEEASQKANATPLSVTDQVKQPSLNDAVKIVPPSANGLSPHGVSVMPKTVKPLDLRKFSKVKDTVTDGVKHVLHKDKTDIDVDGDGNDDVELKLDLDSDDQVEEESGDEVMAQ